MLRYFRVDLANLPRDDLAHRRRPQFIHIRGQQLILQHVRAPASRDTNYPHAGNHTRE